MASAERLVKRKIPTTKQRDTSYERIAIEDEGTMRPGAIEGINLDRRPPAPFRADKRYDDGQLEAEDECAGRVTARDWIIMTLITAVSAALRFWNIGHPASVVFDEVHFGKFLGYYIRREFFFDVHPPLAKLILAFAGWLIGYDGHFEFENIGISYTENNVPYTALRALPALLGSLTPPLMYAIMKESGYPRLVGVLTACLVVFDNAHITQTRLILLDAPLILFMVFALYAYIRFYKLRYHPFTAQWWLWLCMTGVGLALTISCKMVGFFTFMTIGSAVIWDLWNLLDIKRGYTLDYVGRHFAARFAALIVLPAVIYVFWFWVHFAILTKSGVGDDFMSATFQETLIGSPLTLAAEEIRYDDTLIIQHRQTKAYLHTHFDRYPLVYDDGRVSSQGQQVTAYPHNDTNNYWVVKATRSLPSTGRERVVRHDDVIRLYHPLTESYLLTHDVASPLMATHQEFTTWPAHAEDRYNETLFKLVINDAHAGQQWKTKASHFQLVHVDTGVAMWTHAEPALPDWGYKQQEVNGHKNHQDKSLTWIVEEIVRNATDVDGEGAAAGAEAKGADEAGEDEDEEDIKVRSPPPAPKERRKRSFLRDFFELQIAMLQHNAGLTDSHPYASGPFNWPFLLSGISFWTGPPADKEQVYLIGNPVGFALCICTVAILVGMMGADQFTRRRGLNPIPDSVRNRLYNSTGFFLVAWACHYFPFYLMNRQRFLHHYLPAHLCSALVAGGVFDFIISDSVNFPVSIAGPTTRRRPPTTADVPQGARIAAALLVFALILGFGFFAPLAYGTPGLNPEQVKMRQLLPSWTLHFAK